MIILEDFELIILKCNGGISLVSKLKKSKLNIIDNEKLNIGIILVSIKLEYLFLKV